MNPVVVGAPSPALYRVGRQSSPAAFPATPHNPALGRFDDPEFQFRVLYAAETRRACFLETLAKYRPDVELFAMLSEMPEGTGVPGMDGEHGVVPRDWPDSRALATFVVEQGATFLDLTALATREALRPKMVALLQALGRRDFDTSDALSNERILTQAVARWAFEEGHRGIRYSSRLEPTQNCWALFEGVNIANGAVQLIAHSDPDLLAVMRDFNLVWENP